MDYRCFTFFSLFYLIFIVCIDTEIFLLKYLIYLLCNDFLQELYLWKVCTIILNYYFQRRHHTLFVSFISIDYNRLTMCLV